MQDIPTIPSNVSKVELLKYLSLIVSLLQKLHNKDKEEKKLFATKDELEKSIKEIELIPGIKGDKGEKGEKGDMPVAGVDYPLPKDGERGPVGPMGPSGKDGVDGKDAPPVDINSIVVEATTKATETLKPLIPTIEQVELDLPKLGAPIRDALELLQGDDRLDKSAIKGLEELIKELRAEIGKRPIYVGGSSGGGRITYSYDTLSDFFDGSTKTFSLPSFWRIIAVHLSSVPNILRPTIDFTIDGSLKKITFTDQIDAGTALSAGQSCVVVYSA